MAVEEVQGPRRELSLDGKVYGLPVVPTKDFAIYWWDTFEPAGSDEFLVAHADTFEEAVTYVLEKYGDRITERGADRIQIAGPDRTTIRSYPVA